MSRTHLFSLLALTFILGLPVNDCWGRGFGGGGGRGGGGGGGRSFGGGGGGGGGFSGGGHSFGGGGFSGGGYSGGNRNFSGGGLNSGGLNRGSGNFQAGDAMRSGGAGGGANRNFGEGALRDGALRDGAGGGGGAGGRAAQGRDSASFGGAGSDRFSAPSRSQLDGFLGLPSDAGMGALGSGASSHNRSELSGDNMDVNKGTATGDNGGKAAGISVTGPGGTTKAGAIGVGADGGVAGARGTEGPGGAGSASGTVVGPNGGAAKGSVARGPNGGEAARGAAVGADGRVAAGGGVRGPNGGAAARGVVAGPGGAAAGFARVTPSGRYNSAVAVRSNFNNWDIYGRGWYTDHPGAWYAAGWTSGVIWRSANWYSVGAWMPYSWSAPIYYDYGNNVVYNEGNVYVNGDDVGTSQQYYDQASEIAQAGVAADAPDDGEWLPLGVFAFTKVNEAKPVGATQSAQPEITVQLAVNKEGILRGNYSDTATQQTQLVKGSVDKATQRVAFTVGDNESNFVETGLYNLTKDEAPALVHIGADRTEQWLLVRLDNQDTDVTQE